MPRISLAALAALAALALPVASASAEPNANNSPKLRAAVSVDGIREHMAAFQGIADANNANRLAGTPGHDASAQYVFDRLEAAGYDPEFQNFNYTYTGPRTPPILSVVGGPSYASGFQFQLPGSLAPADSGDVTATPVRGRSEDPEHRRIDQRLRGHGLRGLPRGSDRARSARHVRLRREGPERDQRRRQRRHHHERRQRRPRARACSTRPRSATSRSWQPRSPPVWSSRTVRPTAPPAGRCA